MKQKTALLLTAVLAAGLLAACSSEAASSAQPTASPEPTPVVDLGPPVAVPEDGAAVDGNMAVDPEGTVSDPTAVEADAELSELIDAIYEEYPVEVMMLTTTGLDLNDPNWTMYHGGLNAEALPMVDAAVFSESMTGSIPYSMVLVRLKDGADAEAIADAMELNLNPAKWVCVMADRARVLGFDDKLLFVMSADDVADVDAVADAVKKVTGSEFTIDKTIGYQTDDAVAPMG